MRIDGSWFLCDDGVLRPVIPSEVKAADGTWRKVRFLVDSGADRTVFSGDVLCALGFSGEQSSSGLEGVGGRVASVEVLTPIRMIRENGAEVQFNGRFAAFPDPTALDMSVLGRDILNLFAVIIDRKQDVVCLLAQDHSYLIQQH